jgi:hypothetical protein
VDRGFTVLDNEQNHMVAITMEVCDEMVHEIVLKAAKLHSSFKYTDKVN